MIQKINSAQPRVTFRAKSKIGENMCQELRNSMSKLNISDDMKIVSHIAIRKCIIDTICPMLKKSTLSAKKIGLYLEEAASDLSVKRTPEQLKALQDK